MANQQKRRTGLGTVHSNPHTKTAVHASAVATPTDISTKYTQKEKIVEKHDARDRVIIPETPTDVSDSTSVPTSQTQQRRFQGASVIMETFSPHFEALQEAILSQQTHKDIGKHCPCGATPAIYRCKDCFDPPLFCQSCVVSNHSNLPFHYIGEWGGLYFRRTSLLSLGASLHLGHHGGACPHRLPGPGRTFVVVHTNGIHRVSIKFCHCENTEEFSDALQLARARLFPATMSNPESAFTFAVLDDFHQHSLSSKKPLQDYIDALVKRTDPAFPQKVPNRYREFGTVKRIWRYLAFQRRAGQFHGIDLLLTHRRPGSLTLWCPACPEVNFNIEPDILSSAPESEMHKYTLFLSADGNYRLQRKHKLHDPDDVALHNGQGYFVENSKYKEYLGIVRPTAELSTCAHLNVVRLQNIVKFKNADISGVIAIQCARHGFYMTQGMVDLQKGEAYANTDYALAYSLAESAPNRWIMLSYDIWCQYGVNLYKRFAECFPHMSGIVSRIRGAIPSAHIRGHLAACQLVWAFKFIPHSGETYGEMIETSWAEQNQTAGSTKEQNDGHRHDTLDDFCNYWNWTKLHQITATLTRLHKRCVPRLRALEKTVEDLSTQAGPLLVNKWKQMDITPKKVNGTWLSVYETTLPKGVAGPPTQKKAYEALLQKEKVAQLAGEDVSGLVQVVNTALKLESTQLILSQKAASKDQAPRELADARDKLQRDLKKWRALQLSLFPKLADRHVVNTSEPEQEALLLPSDFSEPWRRSYGLKEASKAEYMLREGQAYDALDNLRLSIQTFNYNLKFKQSQVRGQGPNTRAANFLATLSKDKLNSADKYRRARAALMALGLDETNQSLQPLLNTQLWGKNVSVAPLQGETKDQDPWYWSVGRPNGVTLEQEGEWQVELERVKWFRERAARDRCQEEKEILEEEFRRTHKSFSRMLEVWKQLAEDSKGGGAQAYAYEQSAMYGELAMECAKALSACTQS